MLANKSLGWPGYRSRSTSTRWGPKRDVNVGLVTPSFHIVDVKVMFIDPLIYTNPWIHWSLSSPWINHNVHHSWTARQPQPKCEPQKSHTSPSGWWLSHPYEKIWKVSWGDYSQCIGKWKMFQTTNQIIILNLSYPIRNHHFGYSIPTK